MAPKGVPSRSANDGRSKKKPAFQLAPENTISNIKQSHPSQPRRKLQDQARFAAAFPQDILEHIEQQFATRVSKLSEGMERYPPVSWKPRYTLESGIQQLYPSKDDDLSLELVKKNEYTCVSAANTGLLILIMETQPQLLNSGKQFHKLDTGLDIEKCEANPSPFDLHAIRRGDIGYHFDRNGSLGICFLYEGYVGFDHEFHSGFDNVDDDKVLHIIPRDFGRHCFFVKATSNSTPPQKKGLRIFLKKVPKFEEDEDSDEDAIARLFEKSKKSKVDCEEENRGEEDADIEEGGEEYDVDMEEDYEGCTEDYDYGSEEDLSENDEEAEEADFIGLEGI